MASLIEQARAHQEEAACLRTQAVALRLATRQQVRMSHERVAHAQAAQVRLRGLLDAPQPSPWSELLWRTYDAELDRTLVLRASPA